MSRQAALWMVILLICFGVLLRAYHVSDRSLWFDEAFSWRLINFSFTEMIDRAAADVHPPLYYVLLRGWAKVFGSSILALRSFSVVMAGVTIAVAYGFVSYATQSRRTGVTAAALVAVSGWLIAFAWEARMYTLGTALAIASSWLVLRGIRKPQIGTWLLYGLTAAAFAYTHYFAFFTLAAQAVFVFGVLIARTRWRVGEILQAPLFWFAGAGALIAIALYIPWMPVLLAQNSQVQESYWVPPIGGWSIPDTFYRMILPTSGIPPHVGLAVIGTVLPIILAFVVWLLLAFAPRNRDASVFIMLLGLLPFLFAIGISFVGQSLYQDRFLVFASIFLWIGVAVLLEYMPSKWATPATAALLLLLLGGFVRYWIMLDIPNRPGAMAATKYVAEMRGDAEPVIVTSPFVYFAVDHYLQETFGQIGLAKLYSDTGELVHFAGGPILQQQDLVDSSAFRDPTIDTAWLVDTTGFGGSKLDVPAGWRVADEQVYPEVFEYQADVFVRKLVK